MQSKAPILVLDDDHDLLHLLQHVLVHDGYDVITAANANDALAECEKRMPSLIIADLMLPRMDGEAFLAELGCRWSAEKRPPVVLLSASARRNEVRKRVSAAGSLPKPFTLRAIREMVARICGTPSASSSDPNAKYAQIH